MKSKRRKILILHKGGRVLSWCADLLAGFRESGCDARALALRSRNWQERREQWRGGGKLWHNRATPGEGERSGKLILFCGPSKSHGWFTKWIE